MNNRLLYLLPLLLFLAASCDKNTPDPKCDTVTESSPDFLAYWYFPVGSWWVYELKEQAGVYDTVRVVKQQSNFSQPCRKDCDFNGLFDCTMTYYSTLNHSNKNYFFIANNFPANEEFVAQGGALYVRTTVNKSILPPGYIFIYPYQIGSNIDQYITVADTNQVITPLKAFDKSVHVKVAISSQADTTSLGNLTKSLFFTKHIGFTKRVYTGNQTWELVNYHINR